jgi:hypothetical protein
MVRGSLASNTYYIHVEKTHEAASPICWTFYYFRAAKVMRKRADIEISVGVSVDSAQRSLFPDLTCDFCRHGTIMKYRIRSNGVSVWKMFHEFAIPLLRYR